MLSARYRTQLNAPQHSRRWSAAIMGRRDRDLGLRLSTARNNAVAQELRLSFRWHWHLARRPEERDLLVAADVVAVHAAHHVGVHLVRMVLPEC